MEHIFVRCFAELNDFLPPDRRDQRLSLPFPGRASIKDTIEAIGVPHPEVALIVVNGAAVDFNYRTQPSDTIDVYPSSMADTIAFARLQPTPCGRFVLDTHLGRLAERLRLLGFDALYRNDYDDPELAQIACSEHRVLLTRDVGLLKRSIVRYGYFVRATDPRQQAIEIVRRFDLFDAFAPFSRCIRCNGALQSVAKPEIEEQLPPQTRIEHNDFQRCHGCGQIYWRGSHYARMQQFIEQVQQARTNRDR